MKDFFRNHFSWSIVISLAGLFLFIAILNWNSFNSPFERDEGEYAYSGWLLREGDLPYENDFLLKPPMIIYTYALSQFLNDSALWPPRLLAFIFSLLTTFLVGLIARREFGKRAGLVAAWLFAPMVLFPFISSFAANTEKFLILPLVGVLTIYVFKKTQANFWHFALAGALAALALLYKPVVVFVPLFIFFVWMWEIWHSKKDPKLLAKNFLGALIGSGTTVLIALLPFLLKDGGGAFWECAVEYSKYYTLQHGFGLGALITHFKLFFSKWWSLIFLLVLFFVFRPKRWWFYFGLLATSILGIYQSWLGHYYIVIMPFWALICAASIVSLADWANNRLHFTKKLVVTLSTAAVILFILIPIQNQFTMSPEEINKWIYGTWNPFTESRLVAGKLAEITSSDDLVFIAGSEPQILFYAKRRSATRFIITYPFILDTPKRLDYQKETIKDLENNPPKAIVYSNRGSSGLWNNESPKDFINYLTELVNNEYEMVGGYVWENNSKGRWQEPLNASQASSASLVLFKLK